jgi:hypothetical protein
MVGTAVGIILDLRGRRGVGWVERTRETHPTRLGFFSFALGKTAKGVVLPALFQIVKAANAVVLL